MNKQKPIIDRSLAEMADDREAVAMGHSAASVASWAVNVGLVVSAVLTIFYLTLLVDAAAGLLSPWGVLLGVLVGIVAVVPAELGMVIWRARLASDPEITTGQRVTAVVAMIAAGVFAALTTSSFFSYFLPQLFPPSYLAVAPSLNVGAIVGSWIVFILAIVSYSIFSRQTQQNLAQAKAYQSVFDARMVVLKSAGEAIRLEAENMVGDMNKRGIFREDAQQLILASLGMDDKRLALPPPDKQTQQTQQTQSNYRVQRHENGRWQTRVSYPDAGLAHDMARTWRNELEMDTRVLADDGAEVGLYTYIPEKNERATLDQARERLVANGSGAHGANFTQRPNGRAGL